VKIKFTSQVTPKRIWSFLSLRALSKVVETLEQAGIREVFEELCKSENVEYFKHHLAISQL